MNNRIQERLPAARSAPSGGSGRLSPVTLGVMAVLVLGVSMAGFGTKLYELVRTYQGEVDGAFAVAPLVNYLLATTGFLLMLGWAAFNGMFHDIEAPKHAMLDNERRLDQQAALGLAGRSEADVRRA
jgi:hypothetical protein